MMAKLDKIDLGIWIGVIAFWVFVAGMMATNEQFKRAILSPIGLS